MTENIRAKGICAIRQCFVPNDFDERRKEEMAKKFKDNDSPLKIAIVVDMSAH
jgi:type I site-specific restriction-modification system R (restriction) subunit